MRPETALASVDPLWLSLGTVECYVDELIQIQGMNDSDCHNQMNHNSLQNVPFLLRVISVRGRGGGLVRVIWAKKGSLK